MRASLTHILKSDESIEVIGAAGDGREAIEKVKELKPDVALLDIEMPVMDGLTALAYIMSECPVPVIIISGLGESDKRIAIKSLRYGAVDFIAKPSGVISYDIDRIKDEIIGKVKVASEVDVHKIDLEFPKRWGSYQPGEIQERAGKEVVIIGASTGGPRAVEIILSGLRRDISAAVLVVQHMREEFIPSFAERLQWESPLNISIAQDKDDLTSGRVLIAPGNRHTGIEDSEGVKRISITQEIPEPPVSPSIDYAMESAASVYGDKTLGVLLTGIGNDGAKGMKAIKEAGGSTIAEDKSSCVVYGMPKAAIELGVVDEVVPLPRIAEAIMRMI
jgi:two-component system chemotaxis response regulator CheB